MTPITMPFTGAVVTSPREAAIEWVRHQINRYRWLVDRCESERERIQVIKNCEAYYGSPLRTLSVGIGGWIVERGSRHYRNTSWVVVSSFAGEDVNERYPIREIFREAIAEGFQMEIFNQEETP